MNPPSRTTIDRHRLLSATGGDALLIEELLVLLREELPARMAQLRQALDAGDRGSAAQVAHKLQGSAAYTCAERLGDAAARLERALQQDDDVTALVEALGSSIEDLLATLEREAGSGR